MTAKPDPAPEAASLDPQPTLVWKIWSAVLVIAFVTAIWWLIEWRSAPPEPPPFVEPWAVETR